MRDQEWTKILADSRRVKFTYLDLLGVSPLRLRRTVV